MPIPTPVCNDNDNDLLRKILVGLPFISSDSGGGAVDSNVTSIGGIAASVGCGTANTGTLRVAQATDCNVAVVGNVASDAVDSGNPVKVGGQARTTNPTAVANGDRVDFISDKLGKQIVVGSLRALKARQVTIITSSVAETTIVTADAVNVRDLYGLLLSNTSATATEVLIRDATAGGTISSFMVPAGATVGFMLTEGAAWPQATVNNNWTATCGTSVASLKVTALTVGNIA